MKSFPAESLKNIHEAVLADIEKFITQKLEEKARGRFCSQGYEASLHRRAPVYDVMPVTFHIS